MEGCVACRQPTPAKPWTKLPYWALHKCVACGSLTALPRPSHEDQLEIHGGKDYFEHPYFEERRRSDSVEQRCRATFDRIIAAAGAPLAAGSGHLDVGCDTGEFLLASRKLYQVRPVGVEIAPKAVEVARSAGLEVHLCGVEELPDGTGPFELITAIDLIEHLADPASFFQAVRRLLSKNGLLYLETPNPRSVVYKLGRLLTNLTSARPASICQRIFLREHIQYYTPAGLRRAITDAGLTSLFVSTRRLPAHDISGSATVRAGMTALQRLDSPTGGSGILTWGVFRRG